MKNNETIRCNAKRPTAVRRFQLPRHILVVEDDIYILHLNLKGLAKAGYKVAAAHNGEVAWAALQVFTYDLVVTDNCMPNMSGVELLQKMRDAHINPPIMMATGALPENEFAAKPWLRPIAILIKPYTVQELVAAVDKVLQATDAIREDAWRARASRKHSAKSASVVGASLSPTGV